MRSHNKTSGSTTCYDGLLSRPFLAEHWYKGFVATVLSLFLLTLLFYNFLSDSFFLNFSLAGSFSLFLLAAIITQHQRFELKVAQQRYRSCLWVLGLRFGEWHPLPPIDFVRIRCHQRRHILLLGEDLHSIPGFMAIEKKWQVLLHTADSPISLVAAYVDQPQARRIAEELADLLHVVMNDETA